MSGKSRKKFWKAILWIFLGFLILDLAVVGLLFVPSVQTFVVGKVTDKLTEKWGTEISMKDIHITPTLKLVAHDFRICDHHHNDMIYVGTVKGRLQYFSLKPLKLVFQEIDLDKANVVVRKYSGEKSVNFSVWAKVFPHKKEPGTFLLTSKKLSLSNSRVAVVMDDSRKVFDVKNKHDIDYAFYEIKDLNWSSEDFKVHHEGVTTVATKFKHLAYNQYNGFSLTDGQGDFSISDTALIFDKLKFVTPNSRLDMDFAFYYPQWHGLGEFLDSVYFKTTIRPSQLGMQDIVAHVPSLKGMDETVMIEADRFEGPLRDFRLIGLHAGWGMGTRLNGDLAITDITNFKHARITANIDSSQVNVPALANFTLPGGKKIPINKTIAKLGNTGFKCIFAGTPSVFDATVDAHTALGTLFASLGTFVEDGKYLFEGSVSSPDLNLAKLTNTPKVLGTTGAHFSFDGDMDSPTLSAENFKTLQAHLTGDIDHLSILGYNLHNTKVEADYKNKFYNGSIIANDPNFKGDILAQLDLTEKTPFLQGSISLENLDAGAIAKRMPSVDSASATGFNKIVYALQKNPKLRIGFDNFAIALHGSNIENVNGYAACDNIRIYTGEDSLLHDRIRLTALNNDNTHKYILASGIANATLETNYHINSIKDTLQNVAHAFFPTLIPAKSTISPALVAEREELGFLNISVTTYRTWNLLRIILPNVFLASNSTVDIALTSDHKSDRVQADIPFFGIRNKIAVHNLTLDGNSSDVKNLYMRLRSDSIVAILGNNRFPLESIDLAANAHNDSIYYNFEWHNDFNHRDNSTSRLSGHANVADVDDISFALRNSVLYINDMPWEFNNDNGISLQKGAIAVHDLVIRNGNSNITVDGRYAKGTRERMNLQVEKFDLDILNPIVGNLGLGGTVSIDANLIQPKDRVVIFGKLLTDELQFQNTSVGDVFVVAGLDTAGNVGFSGGIFKDSTNSHLSLKDYTFRNFQKEPTTLAMLSGHYVIDAKEFEAQAKFDTLEVGFISPFLSSFSNKFSGTASGQLSFHAKPKSTYLEGSVKTVDVQMGIAALGTVYNVKNQEIRFNKEGIFFDNMRITDKNGDEAFLKGSVKHQAFKNMLIDLAIHTNRIMVLNTPKNVNSVFYGEGIVSGDVSIKGNSNRIRFVGPDLYTLDGTRIVLQITSANSTSQSNAIHFTPKPTANLQTEEVFKESTAKSSTALDFDFTFNVTNDADVVLYLESIGGTMNARADGKFQLIYNENDGINLYGNLGLHSGDFRIALFNVVNSRFTLVPGGSIIFDGPLENMTTHISAYKTSKTSLSSLAASDYFNASANVNAYIHLNGPIMQRIEPSFSFELPNSSAEVNNAFFNALDTNNKENVMKQFAYFMVTNNFLPTQSSNTDRNISSSSLNVFSNIVNNMLGDLFANQNGSFGITYNQATETSAAEYGVTGSANLLKDRMTVETSIGYYDDKNTQAQYNMYGDLTIGYALNKSGTWKVKAYTYIGERDENYYYQNNQINYTAGAALVYKQDFDSVRRKGKTSKAKPKKRQKAVRKNISQKNND